MQSLVAWAGMIRVNGTTYKWMGNDPASNKTSAKVTNIQITPTRSIFVMEAGPMNVTVTFLSPVEVGGSAAQMTSPFSLSCAVSTIARRLGQAVNAVFVCFCGSSILGCKQLSGANVL